MRISSEMLVILWDHRLTARWYICWLESHILYLTNSALSWTYCKQSLMHRPSSGVVILVLPQTFKNWSSFCKTFSLGFHCWPKNTAYNYFVTKCLVTNSTMALKNVITLNALSYLSTEASEQETNEKNMQGKTRAVTASGLVSAWARVRVTACLVTARQRV